MLKPTIFREYDIRGVADVDLPSADVVALGKAFGTYIQRQTGGRQVNLGRDTRLSSPRLRDAILEGLLATGCAVTDIGVVPTPVLYYSHQHLGADGAVMITGSHNPAEYNGFKTMVGSSTIHGHEIQAVRQLIEANDFATGQGSVRDADLVTPYVDEVTKQFNFARRIKVVLDGGNGTAGPVMSRIVERLNVEAKALYFEMDGNFPNHHPDPTVVENLADLQQEVRAFGAELGVAFDGDTDRIGAVDEHGNPIYGDMLLLIYGREILSRKPGSTIIGEVKCSQVLYDELRKHGGNAVMYKTGHSLIKAKMKEEHAELAGEMSGHIFFQDRYFGFDDAIYAACRLMEIVANSGQPLSAQVTGLPQLVNTPEIRVDCPDEIKFEVVKRVVAQYKQTHDTLDIDGARVNFGNGGWGLVRASNTQPVLVMRFEATSHDLLNQYRREMETAVEQAKAAL